MISLEIIQKELEDYDADIWDEMKKKSTKYIEQFNEKSKVEIKIDKNCYILHVPIGDIHLGHEGVDYTTAEYHAKLCGSSEYVLAYNIGDSIDNFIKASILSAIINQTTTPVQQIKLLQQYLNFFNGTMVLMISGNHSDWSTKLTGLDWLEGFTQQNKIAYSPNEFNITFNLCGIVYKFKFRHKYKFSSHMNPTHKTKQMLRNSEYIFDVGCVAHDHEVAMEMSYMYGEPKMHIRCGSYKVADPFAKEIGYNNSKSVLPCFITSPFEKKIIPFWDLKEGIKYVEFLNKELGNV